MTCVSTSGVIQAFGGSVGAVRFLVDKVYADVNAPAGNSGLTPLMCSALCRDFFKKVSNAWSSM